MTESEFKGFCKSLYASFPGLNEWVDKNSPDKATTHRGWYAALRGCSLSECMNVLAGWLDGSLKVFEAYERDKVALVIRAIVHADRDKAAKRNKTAGIGDEYHYTKKSRNQYRPLEDDVPELKAAYAEFRIWDAETQLERTDPVRMAKIKEISDRLFPASRFSNDFVGSV